MNNRAINKMNFPIEWVWTVVGKCFIRQLNNALTKKGVELKHSSPGTGIPNQEANKPTPIKARLTHFFPDLLKVPVSERKKL